MTTINKTAILPHSCAEVYGVVTDIKSYSEFLPWCSSVDVHVDEPEVAEATLHIAKGKLNIAFTTHNEMIVNKQVKLRLLKGPFKRMSGLWTFTQLNEDACKITLKMEFEFSSKILAMALGMVFNQIANSMLEAFCKRTKELYAENK